MLLTRAVVDGRTAGIACFRGWRRGLPLRAYHASRRRPWPLVLRVTPPVSFHPGVVLADDLPPGAAQSAIAAMERQVRRFCAMPVAILYEFGDAGSLPALRRVRQADHAVIDVRSGVDEHLAGLPARHRKRLRRVQRRFQDGDLHELLVPPDVLEATRLEFMTRLRHSRARQGLAPLPLAYLPTILNTRRAFCLGYAAGQRLVQFDLALHHGDVVSLTATGMADTSTREDLYAAALLQAIDWAARHGVRRLELGPGTAEEKHRLGARAEARYAGVSLRAQPGSSGGESTRLRWPTQSLTRHPTQVGE